MIGRLNHVAIAVPDLEAGTQVYKSMLGAKVSAPQAEPDHGVTVVFVELPNTKIELLEPLGEGSPIAAFLEKSPAGGIHHVCYEVDDIIAAATTSSRKVPGCLVTGSPRLAHMASRCCSFTRKTFAALWLSWNRPDDCRLSDRLCRLLHHLVAGAVHRAAVGHALGP
jgi:methylmalonyl-CoA/ethylmalonyl-CoA epimerase